MPAETMIMSMSIAVAVGKLDPLDAVLAVNRLGRFAQMHANAERLDLFHERPRAGVVDLPRHESRRELDDVRLQAEVVRRLGRFESQQSAADHDAALRLRGVVDDPLKIVDRAIDEHARQLNARHRRHERIRTGRQHDVVVGDLDAFIGVDNALLAIDRVGPVAEVQLDAVFGVPFLPGQHQLFGVAMGEERRQADAVVRGPRLLAERDDAKAPLGVELHQSLAEALADHAVADDNDVLAIASVDWMS